MMGSAYPLKDLIYCYVGYLWLINSLSITAKRTNSYDQQSYNLGNNNLQ